LYEVQQAGPQPRYSDPLQAKAADITDAAGAAYDRIRKDNRLSDAGKAARIAPVYVSTKQKLADLAAQHQADRQARVRTLQRQVFGDVSGDPVAAMSRRDAVGRAAEINDPGTAQRAMQQALSIGDTALAQALAQHAASMGWSGALDEYLNEFPNARGALEELHSLAPSPNRAMLDAAATYHPRPPELARMSDTQIEQLAAQGGD
jgi:hypothetical protein